MAEHPYARHPEDDRPRGVDPWAVKVIQRPPNWRPGDLLPHLYAGRVLSGTGMRHQGGRVWDQGQPVRWETPEEWAARTGKSA